MTADSKPVLREFSWAGYRALIHAFLARGYEVRRFCEMDSSQRHVVLRHDIDFSLNAAVDIGRIEAEMGVQAHYYVLLSTEFYNLCSPEEGNRLTALMEMGHDVGLHFDASRYEPNLAALEKAVEKECDILQSIIGRQVSSVSFHRPSQTLLGLENRLAGRQHAYQPQFFSDIAYVADSRGLFRYGHPLDHEAFKSTQAMQLLTHPIWWPETEVENKMSLLDGVLVARKDLLVSEAIANCQPYAVHRSNLERGLS